MARINIAIWPGSGSFFPGDTPFGLYDTDSTFQKDADKVADFAAQKLGDILLRLSSLHFLKFSVDICYIIL